MSKIPVIVLRGLTATQKRTLMLADNKIGSNARYDQRLLAAELGDLIVNEKIDLSVTGFLAAEADQIILDQEDLGRDCVDTVPPLPSKPVSKRGDLWLIGGHHVLCGDARERGDLTRLMQFDRARMVFTDPPYNVRVAGIVGRGRIKHREFAMASGEMAPEEFRAFLSLTLGNAAAFSLDAAIHYACIDWRHIEDLMAVGRDVYAEPLNIITWVKSNAGQGSFYRSQHEMIGVFRVGSTPHQNNVELGRHGRNRSNVWHYAGVNSFGKGRTADLTAHPTVKPVAMIVDAIKDCTSRGDIVLDVFAGSGSTGLACERTGRMARLLEYEPVYVDVTVRRLQDMSGKDAVNAETGLLFDATPSVGDQEA